MAISWRGAKAYQTSSLKIGRLNSTPLVLFEVEADQNWDGWYGPAVSSFLGRKPTIDEIKMMIKMMEDFRVVNSDYKSDSS
jgi:hypothetical protein